MTFRRGDRVFIPGSSKSVWVEATVLLDLGTDTLIVGKKSAASTQYIKRSNVKTKPKKPTVPASEKRKVSNRKLYCVANDPHLCALQRQSNAPSKIEMTEGVFAMCGAFVSSMSAPKKVEPTCPTCRSRLGMEAL